jgi:hypothetical protein
LQHRTSNADIINTKWFCFLQQLTEGQALPGRFAKETKPLGEAAQYWFISGIDADKDQPLTVYIRSFDATHKTVGSEVCQLPLAKLTLLSPQYFRDPAWLAMLERDNNQFTLAPALTLADCLEQSIYHQLGELSVSKQVELLQARPLVSRFLEKAAGNISRQQLTVSHLRHAVTMLGQNALASWVAQAELHQYCQQLAHPHHCWLEQLQNCLINSLLLISDAARQPLSLCSAGLIAHCATLSLWQHAALPQLALAKQVQQKLLLGLHIQQHIWQNKPYPMQVQQLLQHYHQSDWAHAMQYWHSSQQAPLTMLLSLSWQLTLAVFCPTDANSQRLNTMLSASSSRLGLPERLAAYWQQQLIAVSQCYYPLPEI